MNDLYRDVPDWRRLVPRERDVVTGRLTGRRDDKRRQDQQENSPGRDSSSAPTPSTRASRSWSSPARLATAAAVAGVLVVAGVAGVMALNGTPTDVTSPTTSSSVVVASASPSVVVASASPSEAAATAILLSYSGGTLTANECSDASGLGKCVRLDTPFDPLSVRCTPSDCIVTYFGGTGSVAGPLTVTGHTDAASEGCQETTWKLTLTPVGDIVTEGIHHPAKLVGTAHTNRPAEVVPGSNCLGATETYNYDATPS